MKTLRSILLGVVLGVGSMMLLNAQNERAMHPRIADAIAHLHDAIAYMKAAPHDFGGHREGAIRASEEAIKQLDLALHYRAREGRR